MPRKQAAAADGKDKKANHSGGKPGARAAPETAAKSAAGADAAHAAGVAAVVPVGLLAEAEVVGACLEQGSGLLAASDPMASHAAANRSHSSKRSVSASSRRPNAEATAEPACVAPLAPAAATREQPPAAVAGAPSGPLEPSIGCEVRLIGLVAAPDLNGRTGILQEYHQERGRWAVIMPEGEPKLVRPQNLEVLKPAPPDPEPAPGISLLDFKMSVRLLEPCGVEVMGFDARKKPPPSALLELEKLMAKFGFVLFRDQGLLTGVEQCVLTEMFGTGQLHSTHGVHRRAPNQHIFRLSNDPDDGFNEVGSEWHHCGASIQNVFGHVVYHSVAAPRRGGETLVAHTGNAWDALPCETQQELERLVSVNSNGGMVHPLVFTHPRSGRRSLFLHLGMTGAMLRCDGRPGAKAWEGIDAMDESAIGKLFEMHSKNLEAVAYRHRWRAGDVLVLDNLAVAHKVDRSAFSLDGGLRTLNRTTLSGDWPLVPQANLGIPTILDTAVPSPFGSRDHVWEAGYMGMQWGSWKEHFFPH